MSATPETDAVVKPYIGGVDDEHVWEEADKLLNHARALELQRDELKRENERLQSHLSAAAGAVRDANERIRLAEEAAGVAQSENQKWRKCATDAVDKIRNKFGWRRSGGDKYGIHHIAHDDIVMLQEIVAAFDALNKQG